MRQLVAWEAVKGHEITFSQLKHVHTCTRVGALGRTGAEKVSEGLDRREERRGLAGECGGN